MRTAKLLFATFAIACWPGMAAADCDFGNWTEFKGTKVRRNADGSAYMYVTNHSRVDADGAPNAYHPDDVGKPCNQQPFAGLDCPANAGYPNTNWWPSVLVPDPDDPSKAYVQPDGAFEGFFVAMTWLAAAGDRKLASTYVDSTKIPYIVFPGSSFAKMSGTGFKGDVGAVWNLKNGRHTPFIVADQGGGSNAKLGEGSIALYEALGGENVNARTGAGVAAGDMLYVVFPGSRAAVNPDWPRTLDSIRAQVDGLINELGGVDALKSCL